MDAPDLPTSCVGFIASIHGLQRRIQQDISTRDLQTAVKYGVREEQLNYGGNKNNGLRYKITYNNIVYITDATCRKEITSFPTSQLPLEKVDIDEQLALKIVEQKRRIENGTTAITSHTVLIIDQSGSMKKSDVTGHRTRSRAAYYTIANEMIALPLSYDQIAYTDVVTVIEMRDDAVICTSINKEPITWELHNKLVDLSNETFRVNGHGNYLPSLFQALKVLDETNHQHCALMLLFLSDGRPPDGYELHKCCKESQEN